ncbi:hypothetical protein BsWGS_20830 [Bradybaena similaris]
MHSQTLISTYRRYGKETGITEHGRHSKLKTHQDSEHGRHSKLKTHQDSEHGRHSKLKTHQSLKLSSLDEEAKGEIYHHNHVPCRMAWVVTSSSHSSPTSDHICILVAVMPCEQAIQVIISVFLLLFHHQVYQLSQG